ncbi:hypothetical protein M407DRAFT_243034 [Tulasnella calospora MUT 4182]|uniref:Large ribosomal subunit protein uL30m n=1 Tax=Tulasnella calospora MUT 4182 TaxID=1051891 RepID=A0A0C3QLC1_9AGAM|nr:hypothetical protein M407DRAFT_243034 [Tulasnella calospora MUT 4182]
MASMILPRRLSALQTRASLVRSMATTSATPGSSSAGASSSSAAPSTLTGESEPLTHFKITLRRSAIGLPDRYKATLESLGIWRRMQTVFMPHSPEAAGKILRVKELVEVQNVPASLVRTKAEQRQDRKAPRGYAVVDRMLS